MTPERLKQFGKRLDRIVKDFRDEVDGNPDTPIEVILYGIIELLEAEKSRQTDQLVIGLLDSAIQHLMYAGFDYYASYK